MKTQNEKFLVVALVLVLFGGLNFYGFKWLWQKQHALKLSYAELRADKVEAEIDLQKQAQWEKRKQWIQDHEPPMGDEGDAKAQVLQYLLKGARDHNLEILEQNLNDVQRGAGGTRINVGLKIKGTMQGLCEWLAELQKPDSFYAVSQFSLKVDGDQKSMICTLKLARYFKTGS